MICHDPLRFPSPDWDRLSDAAKDFCSKLMQKIYRIGTIVIALLRKFGVLWMRITMIAPSITKIGSNFAKSW